MRITLSIIIIISGNLLAFCLMYVQNCVTEIYICHQGPVLEHKRVRYNLYS